MPYNNNTEMLQQKSYQTEAHEKYMRTKFLHQSARYLGIELNQHQLESLCFDR